MDQFLKNIIEVTSIFVNIFKRREIFTNFKGRIINESDDLLEDLDDSFVDENFELLKFQYINLREFLVILLRITATKFTSPIINNPTDQGNIVKNFFNILEFIPDLKLKLEIV